MREQVVIDTITKLCENYVDTIITGLEEDRSNFVHTRAIIDLMTSLKENHIYMGMNDIFTEPFLEKMDIEISEYLNS
jgi:hypothetical protein